MTAAYVQNGMRTTVRLDPDLIAEAEKVASENGSTVTAIVEEALRESLEKRASSKPAPFPTFPGGWLQPGVNLDSNAALFDLTEKNRDFDGRQRPHPRSPRKRR